ncbi:MAG: amidohydrolase family protein [Candidatus Latescibacteria bacterium]|nr:amidohydrolase family protein [Candidatus Latescibacterota bacterium]
MAKERGKGGAGGLAAELYAQIARIPCINSHSHLVSEAERLAEPLDALSFFNHAYPLADLVAAGMSREALDRAFDPAMPLADRWQIFAPYWRYTRLTGYSQCILEGFADLLGFGELSAATIEPLSEAIRAHRRPGLYREVLSRRAGIEVSVVNMEDLVEVDREFFLPLPRLNRFSMLRSADQIRHIERDYGAAIGGLRDHVGLIDRVCGQWRTAGVAGIKLSQSYHRRMDFRRREFAAAEAVFAGLLKGEYPGLDTPAGAVLEDYLVFECCRAATEAGLAIQFHQGIRAGNHGGMEGCSPVPLIELLQHFRDARFDLSHAGYPYLREGAVLGKTFANVYLNMSWIHIISPQGARQDLQEWLRMVPFNKIIAFGDDLRHVEAVYGHLKMARWNFAVALAGMIEEGLLAEADALEVAQAAFYDNPARLYGVYRA